MTIVKSHLSILLADTLPPSPDSILGRCCTAIKENDPRSKQHGAAKVTGYAKQLDDSSESLQAKSQAGLSVVPISETFNLNCFGKTPGC